MVNHLTLDQVFLVRVQAGQLPQTPKTQGNPSSLAYRPSSRVTLWWAFFGLLLEDGHRMGQRFFQSNGFNGPSS